MLPVLPTIELVLTPVSAFTEFVTLEELFEVIELEELLELIELEELFELVEFVTVTGLPGSSTTLWAETPVHSAKAATVARYLISVIHAAGHHRRCKKRARLDGECHRAPNITSRPAPIMSTPAIRATTTPAGPTFSMSTNSDRPATQRRFITPTANSTAMSAQQQPRQ